jgi:hypothetical protein
MHKYWSVVTDSLSVPFPLMVTSEQLFQICVDSSQSVCNARRVLLATRANTHNQRRALTPPPAQHPLARLQPFRQQHLVHDLQLRQVADAVPRALARAGRLGDRRADKKPEQWAVGSAARPGEALGQRLAVVWRIAWASGGWRVAGGGWRVPRVCTSGPRHSGACAVACRQASLSSHTGSKLGPLLAQFHGPRGRGLLRHMEPGGCVLVCAPARVSLAPPTSQPRALVLKGRVAPPSPPQRSVELPVKARGRRWKQASVSCCPSFLQRR